MSSELWKIFKIASSIVFCWCKCKRKSKTNDKLKSIRDVSEAWNQYLQDGYVPDSCIKLVSSYLHLEDMLISSIFFFNQGNWEWKFGFAIFISQLLKFLTVIFTGYLFFCKLFIRWLKIRARWNQMIVITIFISILKVISFRGDYSYNNICHELIFERWVMIKWGFTVFLLLLCVFETVHNKKVFFFKFPMWIWWFNMVRN